MGDLKKELAQYYESKNLSTEQYNKLKKIYKNNQFVKQERKTYLYSILAFATIIVFFVGFKLNQKIYVDTIVSEVVYNHRKFQDPKIEVFRFYQLSEKLTDLSFEVVNSNRLQHLNLVGGNYCSIQGRKAAQLKYIDQSNGKIFTLYQFQVSPLSRFLLPTFHNSNLDDTNVAIWVEQGVYFALAESIVD
jgi:hypothetical protein